MADAPAGSLAAGAGEAAASRPRRLRALVFSLLMLALSLLVTLAIAEVLIRLLAPQQLILIRPDIWQPADSVGWLNRPGVRTRVNTGERTVDFFTDAAGFRVAHAGPGDDDGSRRVLLIGDSFMQALQVSHEQSVAGLLAPRLSEALGTRVAVRNAAVDGWDPPQYLIRARTLLAGGAWDLLLVTLFTGNDIVSRRPEYLPPRAANQPPRLRMPAAFAWSALVDAVLYPFNDWLDARSHLFVFAKTRLATLRMRLGLTADTLPTEFLRSEAESPRWVVTADICLDIERAAAARGVPVVFAIIPAHFQAAPERFRQYVLGFGIDSASVDLDQPNRLLGAALRSRGLMVVDPLEALRAAQQAGRQLYGAVDFHFSPEGHDAFERAIRPAILELMRRQRRLSPRRAR